MNCVHWFFHFPTTHYSGLIGIKKLMGKYASSCSIDLKIFKFSIEFIKSSSVCWLFIHIFIALCVLHCIHYIECILIFILVAFRYSTFEMRTIIYESIVLMERSSFIEQENYYEKKQVGEMQSRASFFD